jgi:hypothetical protein
LAREVVSVEKKLLMKSMFEGLEFRRFVNRGRNGSIPVSGTINSIQLVLNELSC